MIHVCAIYTQTCKSKDSKQSIKNNIYYKNISNFPNIRNEDSKPKHMKEIEAPPEAKQHNWVYVPKIPILHAWKGKNKVLKDTWFFFLI